MSALKQWWKSLGNPKEHFLTKIEFGVNYTTATQASNPEKVFFMLFENSKGQRSVEIHSIAVSELAGVRITRKNWSKVMHGYPNSQPVRFLFSTTIWIDTVYPWLCGRFDPEIPQYADIPKLEFKTALKGSK